MNDENYTYWKDKSYFDVTREKINNSFKICSSTSFWKQCDNIILIPLNIYWWWWLYTGIEHRVILQIFGPLGQKMRYERRKHPSKQKTLLFSYHNHYKIFVVLGFLSVTCISNTCSYAYLKRLHDVVASSLEMCVSHFTFPLGWY